MNKGLLIGGVVALVVVLVLGIALPRTTVVETIRDNIGAVSGPDINSPYLNVNGAQLEFRERALSSATTTVCSLRTPTDATSTVVSANIQMKVSSTTASFLTWAKGTGPTGSTTVFANTSAISANAKANFALLATTTDAGIANYTFAPGTYLNVTMSGGVGTFSPTGTCSAVFMRHI